MALGKLRMNIEDFYDMTPYEFENAVEGYQESKREEWEMQRLFTAAIVQSNSTKPIDPKKLIHFPWDGEVKSGKMKVYSKEESKRLAEERKKRRALDKATYYQ